MTESTGHYGHKKAARSWGTRIIAIIVGINLVWIIGLLLELAATTVGNLLQASLPVVAISRVPAVVAAVVDPPQVQEVRLHLRSLRC